MFDEPRSSGSSENKTVGDTPDFEVQLIPSWIIFTANDDYRTSQYARFKVNFSEVSVERILSYY